MRIYLLRHGIAEDAGPGTSDSKRQLTDEGREKLAGVLRLARRAGVKPELILSSPLIRAMQTAEIAREVLGVETPLQLTQSLVPHGNPRSVWEELRVLRNLDEVMLAGHEPLMSQIAAFLLAAPALRVHMKKAALVCTEVEQFRAEPQGTLLWMITPRFCD